MSFVYSIKSRSETAFLIQVRANERQSMANHRETSVFDANDYIARAITLAQSPARILNVTGPEILKVRDLAGRIGELLGKSPQFTGAEGTACLLSDASSCFKALGHPVTSLDEMIASIVPWVASGKPVLNKPTKYEVGDGRF